MTPDEAARIAFGTLVDEFNSREQKLIDSANEAERELKDQQKDSIKLRDQVDSLDREVLAKERTIADLNNEIVKLKDERENEKNGRVRAVKAQRKAEADVEKLSNQLNELEEELEKREKFHERRYNTLMEKKGQLTAEIAALKGE